MSIGRNVNRKVHSQYRLLIKDDCEVSDKVCKYHRIQKPLPPLKAKMPKNSIRMKLRGDPACCYNILNLPQSANKEPITINRCTHNEFIFGCISCSVKIILSFEHRRKDWTDLSERVVRMYEKKQLALALRRAALGNIAFMVENALKQVKNPNQKVKEISLDGNETILLESRLQLVMSHAFATIPVKNYLDEEYNRKMIKKRFESKNILLVYRSYALVGRLLRRSQMNQEEFELLEKSVSTFFKYVSRLGEIFRSSQSVYLHVVLNDIRFYSKFWSTYGIGLGAFWSSPGEHANKFNKQDELRCSNFGCHKYLRMLHNKQARLWHFVSELIQCVRQNLKCTACDTKGHQKNNKKCPKSSHTAAFDINEYFADPLTDEEYNLLTLSGEDRFSPPDDQQEMEEENDYEEEEDDYEEEQELNEE